MQLFPEGTDLNDWGVNSSNSFADKNGLPRYKYVLHPRVTGLAHLVHYAHHSGLYIVFVILVGQDVLTYSVLLS